VQKELKLLSRRRPGVTEIPCPHQADVTMPWTDPRVGRLLPACLLAMLALLATPASAAVAQTQPAPDLAQAQALLAEGRAEEAYDLLAPFEDTWAGHLQFDYLLARSALDSGRPSLASFIYERILAVEPNYVGVRLENGRAYLELKNYARAKQEFETVLRIENLPPDLRRTAERYARIAEEALEEKRTFFTVFAEYGGGYDDNINAAIAERVVPLPGGLLLVLPDLSTKQDDFYHAINAGGEIIHALGERYSVFAGIDYRGRFHYHESFFDFSDIEARAGIGRASGRHNVRLSGRYGRFILDDDDLRDVAGATVDWLFAKDPKNQLNVTLSYSRFRFDDELLESNNFDAYTGAFGWNHALGDGRVLVGASLNGGYENETDGRIDGDKIVYGLNLNGQAALTERIGFFAFAGVQRGEYDTVNQLFLREREDTFYTVSSGLTWSFADGWSLRPQVNWSKNDSNIPLSDFDRTDASLNLRADF